MGSLNVRLIRKFRGGKRTIDGVILIPPHDLDGLSHAGTIANSIRYIEFSDKILS